MKDSFRQQVHDAFETELEGHHPQLRARVAAAVASRSAPARQHVWHWAIGVSGLLLVGLLVGTVTFGPRLVGRPGPSPVVPASSPSASATVLPSEPARLTTIRMFTPEVGWVATAKQVLRTTDGGAHWSDVTPDQAHEALRSTPLGPAVAFGGPDQAWLVPAVDTKESRVFRTSDGGRTWQASEPVPIGGWAGQLAFIDSQHGWLLLHLGAAAGSEAVRLLQSSDGGMHWNEVATANFGNQPTGSISVGCGKRGFTFVNASTGWLAGSCAGGAPFLYVSEDGGRAWQRQWLPPPAGYPVPFAGDITVDPPIFVSRQEGVLPVSWTTDKGEPGEVLYVTHDGGQSWKATSFVPGRVNAILNRTDWFAVGDAKLGGDGKLYRTLDGGGTWTPLTTHGSLEGVQQFDFVNDKVGWARKRSVLLKTTDGGRTWTEQTLPGM